MNCPNCKEEITQVAVVSYCNQVAQVNKAGNATSCISPDVQDVISAHCLNCDFTLSIPDLENTVGWEEDSEESSGDYTECQSCHEKISWEMFGTNTGLCFECSDILQ